MAFYNLSRALLKINNGYSIHGDPQASAFLTDMGFKKPPREGERILMGINCFIHDSSVAIVKGDARTGPCIVTINQEERFNREKRTKAFPELGLAELKRQGIDLPDIDFILGSFDIPILTHRLSQNLLPRIPALLWAQFQVFALKKYGTVDLKMLWDPYTIPRKLKHFYKTKQKIKILYIPHHACHAASAFFLSHFDEALILVMDGFGDECSTSIWRGRGNRIEKIHTNKILQSLGILYNFMSYQFGGFRIGFGPGKFMGAAAFGAPREENPYYPLFCKLVRLNNDGTYSLDPNYIQWDRYGWIKPFHRRVYEVLGPPLDRGAKLEQRNMDIAAALQQRTEDVVLHMVDHMEGMSDTRNLVLSGGVALNCLCNGKIIERGRWNLFVPPFPTDEGVALGAALYFGHHCLNWPRAESIFPDPYLGGGTFSKSDVQNTLDRFELNYDYFEDKFRIAEDAARAISRGEIVGWFQDRMEVGPRALGNRSILGDPRNHHAREVINLKVKARQCYRPVAPTIKEDKLKEYFHCYDTISPYMVVAYQATPKAQRQVPGVIHADNTGRVQTVNHDQNPLYYHLLDAFEKITGVPIIFNTSFNKWEPIVFSPADAVRTFLNTQLDVLYIENFKIERAKNQKVIAQKKDYIKNYYQLRKHAS